MCLLLYATLYFETFKWVVESFGNIKFKFAEKAIYNVRKQVEERRAEAERKRLETEKAATPPQLAKV